MDTRFSVLTLPECFRMESRRPMFGEFASDGQALNVGGMNTKSLVSVIGVVDGVFFCQLVVLLCLLHNTAGCRSILMEIYFNHSSVDGIRWHVSYHIEKVQL